MSDAKLMTREELLKLGCAVVNGDEDVLEAVGHLCRHLAAVEEERERAAHPDTIEAAQAKRELEDVESALAQCQRDLIEEIARAEAAEKRVAELEAELAGPTEANPLAHNIVDRARFAAGIREGLERAAVECERERDEWSLACERERNSANGCALRIRAMKAEVK